MRNMKKTIEVDDYDKDSDIDLCFVVENFRSIKDVKGKINKPGYLLEQPGLSLSIIELNNFSSSGYDKFYSSDVSTI